MSSKSNESTSTSSPSSQSSPPPQKRLKLLTNIKSQRFFTKIPIFIVDYHNDVLEFLYRCLATRHLPLENNTIIHFDSHPDMVISRDIKSTTIYNKDELLEKLSIENWLMPTCYAGHFTKIIWLKNSWCNQIPIGKYEFLIGNNCKINEIQVNLPIEYFLSEGNYCNDDNLLENKRNIKLNVINSVNNHQIDENNLIINNNENYILDIDLDFFSTSNPFLNIYKKSNCYNIIKEIFYYDTTTTTLNLNNAEKICQNRRKQLEILTKIFEYLELNRNLDKFIDNYSIIDESSLNILKKIDNLIDIINENYDDDEIDWMLIYNAGCTSDNDGLPHHLSNSNELNEYFMNFENFIMNLSKPPIAITIARSTEDDYCPKNQVDFIQENVIKILKKIFNDKITDKPIKWYENEEWNIMNL